MSTHEDSGSRCLVNHPEVCCIKCAKCYQWLDKSEMSEVCTVETKSKGRSK